jgi:Family of unknown function (DUF6302)
MQRAEAQSRQSLEAWSADEELIITTIQRAESVPRAEAIRRMQRRKKASRSAADRSWHAARLADLSLLDFSIPVRTGEDKFMLAVPVGGTRRGGFVSLGDRRDAEAAAERLTGQAGFPNVRIEISSRSNKLHVVRWGEDEPTCVEGTFSVEAQIAGYKAAGKFFGYSDSAIRAFLLEQFGRDAVLATERLCRNPRCTRGDDGGSGSLLHLRGDALYCDNTCRMAAQRCPKRENEASDRQYSCGSKAHKFGSLRSPFGADEHVS